MNLHSVAKPVTFTCIVCGQKKRNIATLALNQGIAATPVPIRLPKNATKDEWLSSVKIAREHERSVPAMIKILTPHPGIDLGIQKLISKLR